MAYTSAMARLILATLAFSLIVASSVVAQVKITIPAQRFKVQEQIRAKVENMGNSAVTFCVEFGQTSMKDGEVESTPSPFLVQHNENGRWGTLLIGPDVGSARAAVVLEAGESKEFPFRLNGSGRMRLRLNYWHGLFPTLDCHAPPKGLRVLTSAVFTID